MDHQQDFPEGLREIYSGWSGSELDLVPGEGFWARIEQIAVGGEMTRGLDAAMQGQASPRIWLFIHEPGHGELSAAVATSFARELAFRDQAVLLLDCDDRDQALTRWTGRIEAEGWIDLARYGTSVLTSGLAMPFVGRRGYFLGVGSFAPTDVTGEEIDTLMTRLRRQADDILLVAPSDFPGLQWAPVAGIRIFCWDKQSLPANEAGIIAAGFAEAGCPLTAVATFHEAGPVAERLVEEVLTEVEPGEKVPPSGREAAPDQIPTGAPDSTAGKKDVASGVEAGSDSPPAAAGDVAAPAEPESVPPPVQGPTPPSDPLLTRETSRVFWWGALAAVALIAMITVYYFKFVRVPTTVTQESLEVAAQADPSPATGQRDFAGGEADGGEVGAVTDAGADARDSLVVAAAGDSLAGVNRETTPGLEQAAADPPDAAPDAAPDAGTVSPADPGSPEEQLPEPVKPAASGFDMEPYRQPVGSRGWALHVFSLPSQAATREQVQELTRRGFQSEVRVFDLGDKGIWNRVYLGSFSSRDEAREAMPALLEKLREKWAKPVRF